MTLCACGHTKISHIYPLTQIKPGATACIRCNCPSFRKIAVRPQLLLILEQSNPDKPDKPKRRRADRHPRRISPRGREPDALSQREGRTPRVRSSARVPDDGAAEEPEEQIPCPMPRQHRHPQGRRI